MVAAIRAGLGTVVEALADKGASVNLKSSNGYRVSELGEGVCLGLECSHMLLCAVG